MLLTISSRVDSILQFITVVIIFILVLALTYFTTQWIAKYQKVKTFNENIEVVETYRINQNKYIQIVRTGDKYLAIAVSKDTITMLTELSKDELDFSKPQGMAASSFKEILEKAKNLNSKK